MQYLYPDDPAPVSYDYLELSASLAWRERLYGSVAVAPGTRWFADYGRPQHRNAYSGELSMQQPVSEWLTWIVGAGYRRFDGDGGDGSDSYFYGATSLALAGAPRHPRARLVRHGRQRQAPLRRKPCGKSHRGQRDGDVLNRIEPIPHPRSQNDERELLARVAARDTAAFRALYFTYHKRMSRFLMRFLRRHELIEEVINDTMYAVWCKAGDFRGDSQLSTWIFGIAYRKALKALKRAGDHPLVDTSVDVASVPVMHDDGAGQREVRQCIERALVALPPVQRLVIELAYFMGHSCEEIAAITDTPVNTVKTRMFHARERLRTLLPELRDWTQP